MHNQLYFRDIRILFSGTESCAPEQTYGPGFRDYHVVHFITKGKGTFTMNGKTHTLSEGDGFFFPKDTVVTYRADKTDPWHYTWIAFPDDTTASRLALIGISESAPVFHKTDPEFTGRLAELIRALEEQENEYTVLSRSYHVLAKLTDGAKRGNMQEEYVRKASEYMKFNLHGGVTVEDAASYAGIEKSYLFRLFKEHLGKTPMAYLTELRMNEAARELQNPAFLIRDIAYNVGYADQFIFSKAFTKYWGVSPSRYRKESGNVLPKSAK